MRRTTATTEYLKECMGTALLELMREKPFEKITIEEMTAKADVGRSTYFRYFKTKEEVLSFKLVMLWKRYTKEKGYYSMNPGPGREETVTAFFQFCYFVHEVNDQIKASGHSDAILGAYLQIFRLKEENDAFEHYTNNFLAYGLYGIIDAWMDREYAETPEEMARIFMKLIAETSWGDK